MRGWFQLVLGFCAEPDPPTCRAFPKKRLIGFEPTTFCMAINRSSANHGLHSNVVCRAFVIDEIGDIQRGYERICADMQRVGHFSPEVPEINEAGSNRPRSRSEAEGLRAPCRRIAPPRPARSRPATR